MMIAQQWNTCNQLLNALQHEVEKATYGRLTRLDMECDENGVLVSVNSMRYYDVQLVIVAVKKFAKQFPQVAPIQMQLNINGHLISVGATTNQKKYPTTRSLAIRRLSPVNNETSQFSDLTV